MVEFIILFMITCAIASFVTFIKFFGEAFLGRKYYTRGEDR